MEHTEKLFYAQPPVLEFTARVLECEEDKNGWQVVLDRTAFYPEGGGQPADQGLLGGVRVLDVHEKEGVIRHLTDGPLTAGETVEGRVDAARRLDLTQQHSGEHILSGILHSIDVYKRQVVRCFDGTDIVHVEGAVDPIRDIETCLLYTSSRRRPASLPAPGPDAGPWKRPPCRRSWPCPARRWWGTARR